MSIDILLLNGNGKHVHRIFYEYAILKNRFPLCSYVDWFFYCMSQFNGNRMSYIRCIICIICCMLLLHAIVKTLMFLCPSYQHIWYFMGKSGKDTGVFTILDGDIGREISSTCESLGAVKTSDWCFWPFWPIKNVCCSVGIIPNGLGQTNFLKRSLMDQSG